MAVQAEHRFDCDRCQATINVPLQTKPVNQRGPDGWAALVIDGERTVHLCFDCASTFQLFLDGLPVDARPAADRELEPMPEGR